MPLSKHPDNNLAKWLTENFEGLRTAKTNFCEKVS